MAKPGSCHHLDSDSPYAKTGDGGGLGSSTSTSKYLVKQQCTLDTGSGGLAMGLAPVSLESQGHFSIIILLVYIKILRSMT